MAHIPGPNREESSLGAISNVPRQLLHQLYGGKIQALIISGRPGVGKSHLGEKIARRA